MSQHALDDPGRDDGACGADRSLSHRDVLSIALPIIFSNVTTPLIGFVDTTIIGQLGAAHLIGAVAVGAMIFNVVFFGFNFLRMGTTGLTAQALGAGNRRELSAILARALMIAAALGLALVLLQSRIIGFALWLAEPSAAVEGAVRQYFDMRIWAAPAVLINFALMGWFIGLGRASMALTLQLLLNGLNIALAIFFVRKLGLSVTGVGLAALLAEVAAATVGLLVAGWELRRRRAMIEIAGVFDALKLRRMLVVNRDILVRTLALFTAFSFFTVQGVRAGDVILAANSLLFQLFNMSAYLLDGFAFAAEALVGQAIGARVLARFKRAVRLSTLWAGLLSLIVSAGLLAAGPSIIDFMTTAPAVREAARRYYLWAALSPIIGVWCFQLDGIFIGATWTAAMRNMMLLSLALYFLAWAVLTPLFGNHGLWAALMVFFMARALTLRWRYGRLVEASFQPA